MPWVHDISGEQAAMVSAALRHIDDAHTLLGTSPLQAAYLAGYGPECARKAALARWPDRESSQRNKMIGHRFDRESELVLRWFCDLDPLAHRYNLLGWRQRHNPLGDWNENMRYSRSDSLSTARATKILEAADSLTTATVTALWADGRLEPLDELSRVRP